MSAGWGQQHYGVDGYGAGSALSVVEAFAVSTHEVVVVLTKAPLDRSGFLVGDVRNPRSWSVTVPATAQVLDVAGIVPYESPTKWLIRVLQRLPDSTGVARVTTIAKDAAGGSATTPTSADLAGVTELAISTPQQLAATKMRSGRDLRNAPAPVIGGTTLGGVFVIDGGDYVLSDGTELVKKLITRRVTATPGDLFHAPSYGVGIAVKQPLPGGGLVRLKAMIEKQVQLEPDVASVRASLIQEINMLSVVVTATLARTGQNVTVSINSPIGQP